MVGLCYPTICRYRPNLVGAVGCPFPGETQARSQFYGDDTLRIASSLVNSFHILICTSSSCPSPRRVRSCPPLNLLPNELLQTWPHWILSDDLYTTRPDGCLIDLFACGERPPHQEIDGRRDQRASGVVLVIECCLSHNRSTPFPLFFLGLIVHRIPTHTFVFLYLGVMKQHFVSGRPP